MRVRLDLGYDGTDFSGWAKQPGRRTVQGELESALGRIMRVDPGPQLTVAGRTDAGVHARGQVAHFELEDPEWLATLLRRLAGVLPPDVRVHRLSEAPDGFDARFSALARRYAYRVGDAPGGVDPLRRHEVLWHPRPVDVALMNEAAAALLGEHDFAAFCRKREGATTIRALQRLDLTRGEDGIVVATVVADAFCHSMVRALVGSLLAVGDGRRPVEWPGQVLANAVRDSGVHVAPACGLTLEEVRYPPDDELARRAELTRRVRTLS